jgi:acetyl-CoA carboxylase biotin carboxyl carrier protein
MSDNTPSIKELKSIVEWVNLTGDVREVSLKYGDVELFMSRNEHTAQPATAPAPAASNPTPIAAPAPAGSESAAPVPSAPASEGSSVTESSSGNELAAGEVEITAPMVGTFYSGPRPGAPAFVSPGDTVTADTVLGIVEVMKLMNNLEAKVEGTVTRILVENGQAVEYGQPLMVIQSDA